MATKKIEVIIPPFKLEEVRDALIAAGAEGMSVTEVKVSDRSRAGSYRGARYEIGFTARCKLEVVLPDFRGARCVDAVHAHVDGALEIAVYRLDDSVRIRTGEHVSRAA